MPDLDIEKTAEEVRGAIKRRDWVKVGSVLLNVLLVAALVIEDVRNGEASRKVAEYASAASLYLDCYSDGRVSQNGGEHGPCLGDYFFEFYGTSIEQVDGIPKYDPEMNLYDVHKAFDRCVITNNGGVEVHNIAMDFTVHVYGPKQNLVQTYPVSVPIGRLFPTQSADFGFASGAMNVFYILPPKGASGQTVLDDAQRPIPLSESSNTQSLGKAPLLPLQLSRTPWTKQGCYWSGAGTLHRIAGQG